MNSLSETSHEPPTATSSREHLLEQHPWVAFVLPLVVFMLVGTLEATERSGATLFGLVGVELYPVVYTVKILLTIIALVLVWPAYRVFPMRLSPAAIGVGVMGVIIWIGIDALDIEQMLGFGWLADRGERVAYNPLAALQHSPVLAYAFLAVRFFGLAVVIAVAEEMFLRGFLIRYVEDPDRWNTLPLSQLGWPALITGTVFPMLMHPGELFAAMAWFSMVSWLMLRTGNIWDCITAHMVTNLLLGIYVMSTGNWHLW
ncbi:CAAX prenyl protease-related protein [Allorhodopirellula heiligendammensis]|uniref:CAAX amino terminal protease self- immunity n=1 Tax=Allorhodopirellula heiligendammensis TaxID=2714739 RepID=A0A5C6C8L2_9BACT|nr:CAAX prenyl protease-related protein [Allorhodopirellula heiligendammensis]TWU19684.1 CAAX amino terminal protease self- immunity [Allorhodopirellula heiligendammensis]|tara:strand:+ start:726 stop:1499 length:774 start_codon:yes stop_codon:yes gene_type:complete